jgi:ribosomal protein S18 acetylase RimI-like enzyme
MSQLDIPIEPAALDDAPAILLLQKLAYHSEAALYDDYTIPPLTQSLESMQADFHRQMILKAALDGEIVGSVRGYARDGTCYIGRLIVHPDYQNHGLGTRLLRAIEVHFGNVQRYELFTGDRSTRNLHLYQKAGYRVLRTEQVTDIMTLVYLEKKA